MKKKPFFDESRLDLAINEDGEEYWCLTLKRKHMEDVKIDFKTVAGSDVFRAQKLNLYKEPFVNTVCRIMKSWFYRRTDVEQIHYLKWLNQQKNNEINTLKVKLSISKVKQWV